MFYVSVIGCLASCGAPTQNSATSTDSACVAGLRIEVPPSAELSCDRKYLLTGFERVCGAALSPRVIACNGGEHALRAVNLEGYAEWNTPTPDIFLKPGQILTRNLRDVSLAGSYEIRATAIAHDDTRRTLETHVEVTHCCTSSRPDSDCHPCTRPASRSNWYRQCGTEAKISLLSEQKRNIRCRGSTCSDALVIAIRNCTQKTWAVPTILVRTKRESPPIATLLLADGTATRLPPAHITQPGNYRIVATLADGTQVRSNGIHVVDSVRERAIAQCDACNGEWKHHGMRRTEGCNCRTTDAGQRCRSGAGCEGYCLYNKGVPRCSEFESMYGCFRHIPDTSTLATFHCAKE